MSTPNDTAGKGAHYEMRAGQFLCQKGHRVITTNFRCKLGEIDLITRDPQGYLVSSKSAIERAIVLAGL